MKKIFLVVALLYFLSSCSKSDAPLPDNYMSATNFEVVATSIGKFNMQIVQSVHKTGETFTEYTVQTISSADKKLLLAKQDAASVTVTDATAPVHLIIYYNGEKIDEEITQSDIYWNQSF